MAALQPAEARRSFGIGSKFGFGHFASRLGVPGSSRSRSDADAITKAYRGEGATQRSAILALSRRDRGFFERLGYLLAATKIRESPVDSLTPPASPAENG